MRKKISVLLLAAGMVLAAAMPSQAIDFKVKGQWQVGFQHTNVAPSKSESSHPTTPGQRDQFDAAQRIRLHLDAVASENLSGSVEFEIGRQSWGKASEGGALGADGKMVQVRFAYLDWIIPNTSIKTRMGLQLIAVPGILDAYGFSPVFGKEMAGITVNTPLLEGDVKMDATLFWARPYNDNGKSDKGGYLDNVDVFGLVLPIKGDNWKVTPWGLYAMIGKYGLSGDSLADAANGFDTGVTAPRGGLLPVLAGKTGSYLGGSYAGLRGFSAINNKDILKGIDRAYGDGFWFGMNGTVNVTDELRLGLEGAYGSVNLGSIKNYGAKVEAAQGYSPFKDGRTDKTMELRRAGWYVGARADYKLDWGTPGVIAWYGSGDDSNPYNGSERLPQWNTPWATTSLGGGAVLWDEQTWKVLGHNPGGTFGVVAQLDKMSFIENLDHTLRFAYFHGTNSPKMVRKTAMSWPIPQTDGPMAYLTTLDHAYEINLANRYKIYDNLTLGVEGAYVRLNLDNSVWKDRGNGAGKGIGKDHYRVNCVFTYNF